MCEQGARRMSVVEVGMAQQAKKPIVVYKQGQAPQIRPPVSVREPVRVYRGGSNKDRLTITQHVYEYLGPGQSAKKTSRSPYDELLACIYDAVIVTNMYGIVTEVNLRASWMFGAESESLFGRSVLDLVSGADEKLLEAVVKNVSDRRFTLLEAVCLRKDGTRFAADIVANKFMDDQLCFFIRDTSERRQAEDELREATKRLVESERERSRLEVVSAVVNEVNNPLQILTCLAEMEQRSDYKTQLERIRQVLENLRKRGSVALESPAEKTGITSVRRTSLRTSVLVVDDEPMIREVFARALSSTFQNIEMESASDGREAVEKFKELPRKLIVMDIAMPKMTGIEAYRAIVAYCSENKIETPSVIFTTGYEAGQELQDIIRDDPKHCCLKKPFSIGDLMQVADRYLSV